MKRSAAGEIRKNIDLPLTRAFDYQMAMDRLRNYRAPRDKLRLMCQRGECIRVRKGLYVPGHGRGQAAVDPLVLSSLIFGPSYVSLESALAHYGLIPERVEEITCVTSKRAKTFETPIGRFSYHAVSEKVFSCGVTIASAAGGTFFLAEPEKAVCDRIAMIRGLANIRDVESSLRDELRIDMDALAGFRLPLVEEIASLYRRKNVSAFCGWLRKKKG